MDGSERCAMVCRFNSDFEEASYVSGDTGFPIRSVLLALNPGLVLRGKQFGLSESVLSTDTVFI